MAEPSDNSNEAPRTSDSLRVSAGSRLTEFSPAGRLLQNFLQAMNGAGKDAQRVYDRTLEQLSEQVEDVLVEIARSEHQCEAADYPERWALIYAATQLRHEAALPFLKSVVLTPIPPEESPQPDAFSTVAEETILRTTAIEGLEHLATQGNRAALDVLFEVLQQPSISMRRAAVQGILATPGGKRLRKRIAERLPQDQQFLLDIKRVDVRDVPQIRDPRKHLAEGVGEGRTTPAPRLPDEPENDTPRSYKR